MFENFERRRVNVGAITVNCVIGGNGPPLLLLHGFPQNLTLWARVAPVLAENYTVVCADLRGYGDTDKPICEPDNSNYSFRTMAHDNVQLMKALGHETFHVVGHDRGGRTGHRMALDWPDAVQSLALLDIVPTHTMFTKTNYHVAGAYWHWYFLSQPAPFPEHMIAGDPDFFYETCLVGWGAASLDDFDATQLEDYRRCWRDERMIHGSCSDYRAAATVDLKHDEQDIAKTIKCPTLIFYGANGTMAQCFDIPQTWRDRCTNMSVATLPAGHFFVDVAPLETATTLSEFLAKHN